MAKLLHKRINVTDGEYSFNFSFHSPVTVIFGDSGIGKSLFYDIFSAYCSNTNAKGVVFINSLTSADMIESALKTVKNSLFIIDNADIVMANKTRDFYAMDKSNQYIVFGRLTSRYTLDIKSEATITETTNRHFGLIYPNLKGRDFYDNYYI